MFTEDHSGERIKTYTYYIAYKGAGGGFTQPQDFSITGTKPPIGMSGIEPDSLRYKQRALTIRRHSQNQ